MLSTQLSSNSLRNIVHTEIINNNPLRIVIDQTHNEIRFVANDLFSKILSNIFLYNTLFPDTGSSVNVFEVSSITSSPYIFILLVFTL